MLRRVAFGIVLVFLFVLALLFTALNQQVFDVDIAFAEFEVSSGLALLIAFSAGLLAGGFARSRWVAELLAERGRLRRALRLAERRLGTASPSPASDPSGASSPSPNAH
ncbi:MAG: LapA family protein [Gammaproteobacteria bacterium]|nr:LapA family protein [Gammaproteobacteria bacterium]